MWCCCSSVNPKKPSTSDLLWVPFSQVTEDRHWNWAISGVSAIAARAPRSASTFTPLSTGVVVVVMLFSVSRPEADCVYW